MSPEQHTTIAQRGKALVLLKRSGTGQLWRWVTKYYTVGGVTLPMQQRM